MRPRPVRAGIIGLGFIGRAHLDALRRIPGVHVEAVAGSNQRILSQAEALDIPRAYTDYRALLADPAIDVVHNCTPNALHFVINRETLRASKACYSEKPLTVTAGEAAELVRLAADAQVRTAVNFNHRGFPQVQQARALIAAGELGSIYAVHGSYLQDWMLYDTDWNWRAERTSGGHSRVVADIGSHWMDLAQAVTDSRITHVMADLHIAIPVRSHSPAHVDTEDFASVLVRFASGAHGCFTVSQISAGRKNRLLLEVDGARAALEWNSEDSERLWYGTRERAAAFGQRERAHPLASLPAGHAEGWNDALRGTIAGFYELVRGDDSPKPWVASWEDGWRAAALTDAILASHRSRAWVEVPSTA